MMARMLGHLGTGECGCRDCSPPRGRHSAPRSSRGLKRREQRAVEREFASLASWYETGEGREWVERSQAAAENWPLWDLSDCHHGCNGKPCGEPCNFTCHEAVSE